MTNTTNEIAERLAAEYAEVSDEMAESLARTVGTNPLAEIGADSAFVETEFYLSVMADILRPLYVGDGHLYGRKVG